MAIGRIILLVLVGCLSCTPPDQEMREDAAHWRELREKVAAKNSPMRVTCGVDSIEINGVVVYASNRDKPFVVNFEHPDTMMVSDGSFVGIEIPIMIHDLTIKDCSHWEGEKNPCEPEPLVSVEGSVEFSDVKIVDHFEYELPDENSEEIEIPIQIEPSKDWIFCTGRKDDPPECRVKSKDVERHIQGD